MERTEETKEDRGANEIRENTRTQNQAPSLFRQTYFSGFLQAAGEQNGLNV
ncbi:hypothetical protein HAT2_00365 [Candidatus Similichlamydia laticola]|uniref:Uncharacterized protein n=1 Tax=Candidatus Similichlamydia laticola TaxID=2170265 RepID=A0A369KA64_9BACT|nr:hypothetical protein HAT2_00365 [Candidatus Similichlamydia laticola]